LERAISVVNYLEGHAKRLYACAITPAIHAGHALARHIRRGDLGTEFTSREVLRRSWSELSESEMVSAALDHLNDLHWIRRITSDPSPLGGRPSERWEINPQLHKKEGVE
jgi:hypothetical protein